MRRPGVSAVLVSLALLGPASSAQAATSLKLSVRAKPISTFRGSGALPGAGVQLEVAVKIGGSDYGGGPPPLESLSLTLPPGMRFSTAGFPVETPALAGPIGYVVGCGIEGGPGCARGVAVGAPTPAAMRVAFGAQRLPEIASVMSFDDGAGGVALSVFGHEPVVVVALIRGYAPARSSRGTTFDWDMPTIETVPGALLASTELLTFNIGSGRRTAHRARFSLYMPHACPRAGLKFTLTAGFGGSTPETATTTTRVHCRR